MLYFFFKKIKKTTCRCHYQNLDDMIYMMYSSWEIEQNILKLVILGHLLPFSPHKTPKSKFWKIKKFVGDIIILHMCTKNHKHLMYSSWDTEWDRQNFMSFWTIFCPLSPLTTWKIQILKLKKTPGDVILRICTISDSHIMYGSWDMECNRQNFCHSGPFFVLLPPNGPRKSKFWKN